MSEGITIWPQTYRQGTGKVLTPGVHYNQNIQSMDIPDGLEIWAYDDQHKYQGHAQLVLGPGCRLHREPYLGLHGCFSQGRYPKIEVKRVQYGAKDCVFLVGRDDRYGYEWYRGLPVGTHEYASPANEPKGNRFWNDMAIAVEVPHGGHVKLYKAGGATGAFVEYGEGRHELPDGFKRQISSVVVAADGWEVVGLAFDGEADTRQDGGPILVTREYGNNRPWPTGPDGQPLPAGEVEADEFACHVAKSMGFSAKVGFGMAFMIGAELTAEAEVAPLGVGGKVSATAKWELTATANKELESSSAYTVEDTVTAKLRPGEKVTAAMEVYHMTGTVPVRRTWRNTRTGQTYDEHATMAVEFASRGNAYLE